jgi:hypothetical protein
MTLFDEGLPRGARGAVRVLAFVAWSRGRPSSLLRSTRRRRSRKHKQMKRVTRSPRRVTSPGPASPERRRCRSREPRPRAAGSPTARTTGSAGQRRVELPAWYGPSTIGGAALVISPHAAEFPHARTSSFWATCPPREPFVVVNPEGKGGGWRCTRGVTGGRSTTWRGCPRS